MTERVATSSPTTVARRVILVTEQVRPGGKRSHVETLRDGLREIGRDATIVDWARLSWLERAWVAGPLRVLDHFEPALGHRWMIPAFNRRVAIRVRRERNRGAGPGVIHVQEAGSYAAARGGAGGWPVVLTVHGPWHREIAMVTGLALEHPTIRYLRDLEGVAFREADAVIAVDRAHAEYVRSFGRSDRMWVITNFVDTQVFNDRIPAAPFPDPVERWIAGRPVVFCPRRLTPKNGVPTAVRAMTLLKERGTRCALVVAGYGPQRDEIERLIRELGVADCVWLLGAVAPGRMPAWFRRAALSVVPSVSIVGVEEATSIAALEGQACGRPVVASALGGLREIIEDGDTGLLVPPGEPAPLADAIERVLKDADLAERLSRSGAAAIRDRRSHVAAAREYAAIYDQVLGSA